MATSLVGYHSSHHLQTPRVSASSDSTSHSRHRQRPLSPLNPNRYFTPPPSKDEARMQLNTYHQPPKQQHQQPWHNAMNPFPMTPESSTSRQPQYHKQRQPHLPGMLDNDDDDVDNMDTLRSSSPPLTSPTPIPSGSSHPQWSFARSSHPSSTSNHQSHPPQPPKLTFSVGSTSTNPRQSNQSQSRSSSHLTNTTGLNTTSTSTTDTSLNSQLWKEKFRQRCLKGPRWSLPGGSGNGSGSSGGGQGNESGRRGSGNVSGIGGWNASASASGSRSTRTNNATNTQTKRTNKNGRSSSNYDPRLHQTSSSSGSDEYQNEQQDRSHDALALAENEEIFRRLILKQNRAERRLLDVGYEREVGSDPILAVVDLWEDQQGADEDGWEGDGPGWEEWQEEEEMKRLEQREREEKEREEAALQVYLESQRSNGMNTITSGRHDGNEMMEDMQGIDWNEVLADDGLSDDDGGENWPDLSRNGTGIGHGNGNGNGQGQMDVDMM